jgi:hypothetical protein
MFTNTTRRARICTIALFRRPPYPSAPYAVASFGLVTPIAEVVTILGATRALRRDARVKGSTETPVILDYLENSRYSIPGTAWFEATPRGLIAEYIVLVVLAAVASALGCFLVARRHAYARGHVARWTVVGFLFGWVGFVLMLAIQEWPARVACPSCRKPRVVTREACEHCGASHAVPAPDGTEIFEPIGAGLEAELYYI